jgi:arginyl-tRNA synthetase
MHELKQEVIKAISEALSRAFSDVEEQVITLEHPADENHGEWASNIAMRLTKQVGIPPREVAEKLIANMQLPEGVENVEVAGPGFINFQLHPSVYLHNLTEMDHNYGGSKVGEGKTVMIEFGQPNTHKAFHVGHLRSAISGLAMVKLYENLGYQVIKANYFGDIGLHVAKCTWGMQIKGIPEDFATWDVHERMRYIDEAYVYGSQKFTEDKNAEIEIRQINKDIYMEASTPAVELYHQIRVWSIEHQTAVFADLGVEYDVQYPESTVYKEAIKIVENNKDVVFTESEGAIIYDGKKDGLTTWVFLTSEGNPTYSAKDLALALTKFRNYDLDHAIVTTSVEQVDYFRAVIKCLEKIEPGLTGKYKHLPFGWLLRDNKKTSSRQGGSIKGMDILSEVKSEAETRIAANKDYAEAENKKIAHKVGLAGLKFLILSHEFHKDINYDPERFLSLEGFSAPYIMYAYARAAAIMRQAESDKVTEFDLALLDKPEEMDLARLISRFPETAEQAALQTAPHLMANYLYQLAQKFNQFYGVHQVLNAEAELRQARLYLVNATSHVLKLGLELLGIETVERM